MYKVLQVGTVGGRSLGGRHIKTGTVGGRVPFRFHLARTHHARRHNRPISVSATRNLGILHLFVSVMNGISYTATHQIPEPLTHHDSTRLPFINCINTRSSS